jgi:hypothetical protein
MMDIDYLPMPEEASTVTFTEYPEAGWIGVCTTFNCEGDKGVTETARGVMLNYEYDASVYYFIYYVTSDAYTSWDEEA